MDRGALFVINTTTLQHGRNQPATVPKSQSENTTFTPIMKPQTLSQWVGQLSLSCHTGD